MDLSKINDVKYIQAYVKTLGNDGYAIHEIFYTAIHMRATRTVEYLLTNLKINPSVNRNQAIVSAVNFGSDIVRLLLADKRVNPADQDNQAVIVAATYGHAKVVKMLLSDKRVNPSTQNNSALLFAIQQKHPKVAAVLLDDPRVDPSTSDNTAILQASSKGYVNIVNKLLKDRRVNPSVLKNQPLIYAVRNGHVDVVRLFLNSLRVDLSIPPFNDPDMLFLSKYTGGSKKLHDELKSLFTERRKLDTYFGLITEDDYYKNKPVEILKQILSNRSDYGEDQINYIFTCLDKSSFDEVIDSDISDVDLSFILSNVKNIKYDMNNISTSGERARDTLIVFGSLTDHDFLTRKILEDEHLLPILTKTSIDNQNLLKIYRKYDSAIYLPLLREYQLVDIIFRRDIARLYKYVLNGKYLPYVDHPDTRLWVELSADEKNTVETFRFPAGYHDDYVNNLDVKSKKYWEKYIGDDPGEDCAHDCANDCDYEAYVILNDKLRDGDQLNQSELEWFNSISADIIGAPVTNKRCVLYRGIEAAEFVPPAAQNMTHNTSHSVNTFVWNAFSSCSSIKEIADAFAGSACCLFIIIVPTGAVLLEITPLKNSEFEIVLPPGSIMKYLGTTGGSTEDMSTQSKCHVLKYMGYETTANEPYYFEPEEERNMTLEEEMIRYE